MTAEHDWRSLHPALLFLLIFAAIFALHGPLLQLPYFWDEAGYYIPAARDLFLTGSLIPHSTPTNAHPPLVMAYLASCWKLIAYTPSVTRTAMLLVAAFSLLGLFRLAQRAANFEVAAASTLCTAIYPVFFVQSTFAQVDLAAAGLTFWGLLAYVEDRMAKAAMWFCLAALAKETAILAPLGLAVWEVASRLIPSLSIKRSQAGGSVPSGKGRVLLLLTPLLPLIAWYAYHRSRTGFIFGNPEFFRYNVQATTHPLRIVLAFVMRLWQAFGYMNLYLLTISAAAAMWIPPQDDRPRIALPTQFAFLAVAASYIVALSIIGGAVLARYMLPVVPLGIVIFVSTVWRRIRPWKWIIAIVALGFVAALFINPPYGFSLEDNLAYRDYVLLHQRAETLLEARYPAAQVLTAWPASGELSQTWLGYVTRPMRVMQIENFTLEELMSAAELRPASDVALVFSTKYEPPRPLIAHWPAWEKIKSRFFGYHRDLPPAAAAQVLGGRVVYSEVRNGQWIGIIELQPARDAGMPPEAPRLFFAER